jgi:hypothetical protein
LYKLFLIGVNEKIGKERSAVYSHLDADELLKKNVSSELDKYVINKELQRADDFTVCVLLYLA